MSALIVSVLLASAVSVGGNPGRVDTASVQESGSAPAGTSAQTDADEIRARLKDGQKIRLVDDQGRELNGRIDGFNADALILLVGRDRTEVRYERILRIDRPRDGVLNGTLIGFGVGAGLGVIGALAVAQDSRWGPDPGDVARIAPLLLGGIGAGIGLGLDAVIRRQPNIYRRPGSTLRLLPTLGHSRRGVAIAMSW